MRPAVLPDLSDMEPRMRAPSPLDMLKGAAYALASAEADIPCGISPLGNIREARALIEALIAAQEGRR